ncbi:hypothetical protein NP493_156g01025 [Ridgeia piscesae]|uniref:Uncharacterized protein n=1 Tax=Ridgeia piscesae TaxID=27915 RepID=A0AAD9P3Z1_RIDPI|nr:hypothetical protein NP493_156g01025 [Ridgeia piscesae]
MLDVQQKAFQACLQSFVEANNKRVDELVREQVREITDLRMSLQYPQREIDEMKMTIHSQSDRLSNTTRDVEQVTCAQREMEDGVDYVKNQMRRNNLRIDGVAEITARNWADTEAVVRKSFTTALKLPEAQANATVFALSMRTERDPTLPADQRPSSSGSRRTRTETASCKPFARRNRVASS